MAPKTNKTQNWVAFLPKYQLDTTSAIQRSITKHKSKKELGPSPGHNKDNHTASVINIQFTPIKYYFKYIW